MKHIVTIYDENSPNYMVSSFHAKIGTSTIICDTKEAALLIMETYPLKHKSISRINISSFDDNEQLVSISSWFREE
ncbi:hypothetical protein LCGC14_3139340 [marine sediment metagenome]|uniref:Uncharacterized protein n=1 Tax=marine sediment metagenome TaxID=412755 RepID=A0A0F8WLC1_9ZZZZ